MMVIKEIENDKKNTDDEFELDELVKYKIALNYIKMVHDPQSFQHLDTKKAGGDKVRVQIGNSALREYKELEKKKKRDRSEMEEARKKTMKNLEKIERKA